MSELRNTGERVDIPTREATDEDIAEFMRGKNNDYGGRHDMEDRGMGSGIGRGNGGQWENKPRQEERMYVQDEQNEQVVEQEVEQPQDFKKLYGQSENEKGELRRANEQLQNQLNSINAEIAQMRASFQQPQYPNGTFNGQPQQVPGYGYAPQQPQIPQLPANFFTDKDENDFLEAKDVNKLMRELIGPAVIELHQEQQRLVQAQTAAAKQAAGVDNTTEQRLLTSYPWLRNLRGQEQLTAMQSLLQQERQQAQQQQTQSAPPPPAAAAPAARRVTYIESGTGRARTTDDEDSRPVTERIREELAEAKRQGGSFAMKKVLAKHGIGQVNDFGPEFLTR